MFSQNFTCSDLLKDIYNFYAYRTITYFGVPFQTLLLIKYMPLGCRNLG